MEPHDLFCSVAGDSFENLWFELTNLVHSFCLHNMAEQAAPCVAATNEQTKMCIRGEKGANCLKHSHFLGVDHPIFNCEKGLFQ